MISALSMVVRRQSVWDKNLFLLMDTFPVDVLFNHLFA